MTMGSQRAKHRLRRLKVLIRLLTEHFVKSQDILYNKSNVCGVGYKYTGSWYAELQWRDSTKKYYKEIQQSGYFASPFTTAS